MKLMIDTNIVLDVLEERKPFLHNSQKVLKLCESSIVKGYVSASSITDIFYLVKKALGSTEKAYQALSRLFQVVHVLPVTERDIRTAFQQRAKDFEDCLLATCAKADGCDGIVTFLLSTDAMDLPDVVRTLLGGLLR